MQVLRDGDDVVDGSGLAATSKGKAAVPGGGGGGVKRRRGRESPGPSWSPPVVVVTAAAAAAGGVVDGVLSILGGGACCPSPGISGDRCAHPPRGRAVLFSCPALLPDPHSGDLLKGSVVSKIEMSNQARLHIDGGLEALE